MMEFIDLKRQYEILKDDISRNIQAVLEHGQYIMGPEVEVFENKLSEFVGVKHAVSCANGTDALTLLYMAYGIEPGDAIFCSDVTFVASVEPAVMLGGVPVFCDITPDTYCICPRSLERQIEAVIKKGKNRPRFVVAVDFLGNPANMDEVSKLCRYYDLIMIEDAAQSIGATYHGKRCGSFGDSAITSFFPAKPLGCYGDGGAVLTNDDGIAELCRSIRVHGKGSSKYDNVRVGLNSRLDTLQAAIMLPKLRALEEYEIDKRRLVAGRYNSAFSGKLLTPEVQNGCTSIYAQYAVLAKDNAERDFLSLKLTAAGIPNTIYYPTPQHALRVFSNHFYNDETFANAIAYCNRTLSLPMHPYMSEEEQDKVVDCVNKYIKSSG